VCGDQQLTCRSVKEKVSLGCAARLKRGPNWAVDENNNVKQASISPESDLHTEYLKMNRLLNIILIVTRMYLSHSACNTTSEAKWHQ
jgi:hypothetical protein